MADFQHMDIMDRAGEQNELPYYGKHLFTYMLSGNIINLYIVYSWYEVFMLERFRTRFLQQKKSEQKSFALFSFNFIWADKGHCELDDMEKNFSRDQRENTQCLMCLQAK